MNPKRAAGVGLVGRDCRRPASPPRVSLPPGTGSPAGRCRSTSGTIELDGLEGPVDGAPRPLGRAPHRGRQPRRPLLRAGLLPRPGPALADRLLPPRRARPGLRDGRRPRALPIDRLMLTLGIRRVAEREAAALDPETAPPAGDLLRRRQRRRRGGARRRPSRCSCCGSSSSPGARSTSSASASCSPSASRPTGRGSCCAPTWPARSARSWPRGSTPAIPADNPVVTQEPWNGDGPRGRRADRRRAPLDRARGRGQRLQQLGGHRQRSARPARR